MFIQAIKAEHPLESANSAPITDLCAYITSQTWIKKGIDNILIYNTTYTHVNNNYKISLFSILVHHKMDSDHLMLALCQGYK